VHDDVSPIDAPRHAGIRPGIYLARFPHFEHLDFRVEAASTDPPTGRSIGGAYLYAEHIQSRDIPIRVSSSEMRSVESPKAARLGLPIIYLLANTYSFLIEMRRLQRTLFRMERHRTTFNCLLQNAFTKIWSCVVFFSMKGGRPQFISQVCKMILLSQFKQPGFHISETKYAPRLTCPSVITQSQTSALSSVACEQVCGRRLRSTSPSGPASL
jgi:hypothetical protein